MPSVSAIVFCAKNLDKTEIRGKRVIDVGSYDFNGSIRPLIESWKPDEYIGVDILEGKSVDIVCSAEKLQEKFGSASFDIVISIEMLEHARNWKKAVSNLKKVCKTGGIILITTRSYGYPYHGYPGDFWRYEVEDMKQIFADFKFLALERDYQSPGVFIKVKKPNNFVENNLFDYKLHSMVLNQRVKEINNKDFQCFYFKRLVVKEKIKKIVFKIILESGKYISKALRI